MTAIDSSTDWQALTVRAFVLKQKRDRYVDKIASPKWRPDFVRGLAHFADFDPRFIVHIPPSSQYPDGIESLLRAKGAPTMCSAISELDSIDCKHVPLVEALNEVIGRQMGTILCCVPGSLAYFENEDGRFILERKS